MENDVAATEAEATPPSEESAVVHEQSLDEILAGVENDPAQPETQVESTNTDQSDLEAQLKALAERQAQFEQQQSAEQMNKAMGDLVSFVRDSDEAIGKVYDEEEIRALLEFQAIKNPKIGVAFANQASDPATWNKVQKSLAAELATKAAGKTSNVEQQLDAAASVRGVSTTPPPEQDLPSQAEMADMAMNDPIAFRRFKEKLG